MVCATLQTDEYCLWRDSKDNQQSLYSTVHDNMTPSQGGLTPAVTDSSQDEERSEQMKRLCDEAAEYIRQADYPQAIRCLEQALELDPNHLTALNNLAIIYEKQPQWYPKALELWRTVLELSRRKHDEKHATRAQKHLDSLSKLTGNP